jgi:hypothetical protein
MMDNRPLVVAPPDMTDAELPMYANVVHISSTPFDFRLTFSILQTPHGGPRSDPFAPSAPPRLVCEVAMPVAAVESLIDVLKHEVEEYTNRFGAPQRVLQAVP